MPSILLGDPCSSVSVLVDGMKAWNIPHTRNPHMGMAPGDCTRAPFPESFALSRGSGLRDVQGVLFHSYSDPRHESACYVGPYTPWRSL